MEFECHYRSILNISEDSNNVPAHPLRPQQKICIISKSLSFARILLGGEVTFYNVIRTSPAKMKNFFRGQIFIKGKSLRKDVP